jgi:hypothetical protein
MYQKTIEINVLQLVVLMLYELKDDFLYDQTLLNEVQEKNQSILFFCNSTKNDLSYLFLQISKLITNQKSSLF